MTEHIHVSKNIIKKNKISVLIKDKTWKTLFESSMTKNMKKTAKELEKLLSEEKSTMFQLKINQRRKKKLMEKILYLSDEINHNNNESALIELEKAKEEILKINEQMDEFQFKLEMLPRDIEKYNLDLLKETIQIAYNDIKEGNERADFLTEEILRLRQQLSDAWEEKLDLEQRVEALYSYLHDTLGYEETNKLDKQFLSDSEQL